ncbi:MAG: response regulator [Anaerolineae bacterium]|nr:response regulator [Anaerolineae bacterium]
MSQRPRCILMVDDDDILRAGVRDLLELSGYIVYTAADGAQALQLLEHIAQLPHLIISDIRMPGMDGYEFLDTVRARPEWLSIPFIFLSAKGEKEDVWQGRLRGADDYIIKPFEFQDLLVAIQSSLKRHEELIAVQEARLESLKSRILHILNHEFRTPLTYIVAYADLMAESPSFQHSEELRGYIDGILQGNERLTKLISNFLMLAELESGLAEKIYERRKAPIDNLNVLLKNNIEKFEEKAKAKEVTINLHTGESIPPVIGDIVYLEAALEQLLDNAVKFSPAGKHATVSVSLESAKSWVSIVICDQGPGISAEQHEQLFSPFYQIDRDKKEQGGTGAGLAIVRHIATMHGGQIILETPPQGVGCGFKFNLPASTLKSAAPATLPKT